MPTSTGSFSTSSRVIINLVKSKGFAPIIILIIFVLVAVGAYYFGTKNKIISVIPTPTPVVSIQPSSSPVAEPTAGSTTDSKTYKNIVAGYSLKIPVDYKILENVSYSVDGVKVDNPNTTTLISPTLGNLKTNMQITIHYENATENLSELQIRDEVQSAVKGEKYTLDGKDGYLFTNVMGPFGGSVIYCQSNDKTYTIKIESMGVNYSDLQKYLDPIFSTFKFIN